MTPMRLSDFMVSQGRGRHCVMQIINCAILQLVRRRMMSETFNSQF